MKQIGLDADRRGTLAIALAVTLGLSVLSPLMTFSGIPLTGEGSPIRQAAYMLSFLLAAWSLNSIKNPARLFYLPLFLAVALAWCWLSAIWAIEPSISIRRLILTSLVILVIFSCVRGLGFQQSVLLLKVVLLLTLIANYVAVLVTPSFGLHTANEVADTRLIGDWRGIMMHKNIAGATSALTVIVFLLSSTPRWRWTSFAVAALAFFFLFMTESRTSLGITAFSLAAGTLFSILSPRLRIAVIPLLFLAGVAAVIATTVYWNPITADLYDPKAFTGRTQIWRVLLAFSHDNFLLGSGFGSFWNIGPDGPIYRYASGWVSQVTTGHNGYLDLLVQLGLPGLVLVVVAVLIKPLTELLTPNRFTPARGGLIVGIILFCTGHNFTESSIFDRDSFVHVALVLGLALLAAADETPRSLRRSARAADVSLPD
jgi:O-antigen ligase